jgi:multicomponent Na+:H+ antiporter subunit F
MSAFEILLVVYAAVLALASLAVVVRMIIGPTILDRAISTDSLVTLVIMGMALHVAHTGANWAGPAMMSLAGLAFVGTVTFARFVAREDPLQGRRRHPDEPETDTVPHDAIHLETDTASENGFADDEVFGADGTDGSFGADGTVGAGEAFADDEAFVGDADDADDADDESFGADGSFGAEGPRGFEDENGGTDETRGGAR